MSDFVSRNKPEWDELERLVRQGRRSLRRLSPEDLSRLDVLYRRIAVQLAQVSTRGGDSRLASYLNDLAAAAHSLIYLPPRESPLKQAAWFLTRGFAQVVARHWRFHAISAALLLGGAAVAFWMSLTDPVAAYALMMPNDPRTPGATREQLLDVLRAGREQGADRKFFFASFLFSHNLWVGIVAMGTGVLAAIPTTVLLIYNGMMLGAFMAIHHRAGIDAEVWAWILPHGITEIGAIVLCGGVGLLLGRATVSPGLRTRGESLLVAGREAGLTCLGVALMLILAAVIESYLRQSELSTGARLAFAAGSAVFWAAYIALGALYERAAARRA